MTISFARHQFLPAAIRHAVWLYMRFTLNYRDVEDLLAERGLDISYGCCHTNLIPVARGLEGPLRLRPQWRLATSGMLRLGRRGACGEI